MLKQRLQQKLLQKLSPQQIQLIKLLEVPTVQLEQGIKKEIEENPILEEGHEEESDPQAEEPNIESSKEQDEFSLEDYLNDEDIPSYKLYANNYSRDDQLKEIPFSMGTSFDEYLRSQLGLRSLNERQNNLALYLIGNIDENGYMRRDLDSIVDDLAFLINIETTEKELIEILEIIQEFDPPGVGARDLRESLILQIDRLNHSRKEKDKMLITRKILRDHFDEFSKRHFDKILSRMNITEEQLKKSIEEVQKLNPNPGSSYSDPLDKTSQVITPDFILEDHDGELILSLNSKNAPELRINKTYANMLVSYGRNKKKQTKAQKETVSFVKQKLDSAKWFIYAIKQRQHTLIISMNAIINLQKEYFLTGNESKLKPMILKDIAEKTGLDISTISRVANSKYIQTPFGIISLKYFFSEGLQTDTGDEVSTREIKKILQECIDKEDKKKPLTDEKLTSILQEKGYQIARRTVAKYREQLYIQVARLRKEL